MRTGTGIAGATLLFGPKDGRPDLVQAMQFLVDDLRGDGRRIGAMKLTGSALRLRADPYELVLTLASRPIPPEALQGLLRPVCGQGPDFARVHLTRALRQHGHVLGFLIRRRAAPTGDWDTTMLDLTREGRQCLMPVLEAALPAVVVWQPGGLVLTAEEFRRATPALLLTPGDHSAPITLPAPERLALARPGAVTDTTPPSPFAATDRPDPRAETRAERAKTRSLGRLFAKPLPERAPLLPRLDPASDRVTAALRDPEGQSVPSAGRKAAAFWSLVLPSLGGFGGVS